MPILWKRVRFKFISNGPRTHGRGGSTGKSVLCGLAIFAMLCALPLTTLGGGDKNPDYEDGFTFKKGGLYAKDPNIWVYTKAFAQRFGMPDKWVDDKLEGIEAAAWRVEPGQTSCGFARQEKACAVDPRCVLDLYIDTTKYKLPWAANSKELDYDSRYTSLWILQPQGDEKRRERTVVSWKGWNYKSPFADPANGIEAHYYIYRSDSTDRNAGSENFISYEKSPYAGLSMVSLSYGCFGATDNPQEVRFELQSREKEPNSAFNRPIHTFHKFKLPKSFENQVKEKRKTLNEQDHQFYKGVWESR